MSEVRYQPERTVYVDMDNVVAGFDIETVRRAKLRSREFKGDLPRTNFYIADDYPEFIDLIRTIYSEEGFFRSLPVIDGALEGWQTMVDAGWQPRILSSPLSSNPTSEPEKREWLAERLDPLFGPHISRDAIITKDKYLYNGVALLDDKGVIPRASEAKWSHVVVHYPHNEAVDTDLRLHGMNDPHLEMILGITHERYVRKLGRQAM